MASLTAKSSVFFEKFATKGLSERKKRTTKGIIRGGRKSAWIRAGFELELEVEVEKMARKLA